MITDEKDIRKAMIAGDAEPLRQYLISGGDPNSINAKGMSLLMTAIWAGKGLEMPLLLLDAGADLRPRQPSTGWRAFHFAAVNDHVDILNELIKRGDAFQTPDDWKALHYAAQYRAYRTIPILIGLGADIDLRDDEGRTPLMRAAKSGIAEMVTLLLKHGAEKGAVDAEGRTAKEIAIATGKKKVVELL